MWTQVEPLSEAPEQRAYWHDFKVGDRVRVRLSGECPYTDQENMSASGMVGVITRIDLARPSTPGHCYMVTTPQPCIWGWAAACELEPVT